MRIGIGGAWGVVLGVMLGWGGAEAASAASVTITADRDGTLYDDGQGGVANGSGEYVFAGTSGEPSDERRRALVHFDVAGAVPAGAVVESAELVLTMTRTISGDEPATLHRVTADWGEGASHAPGEEGAGTDSEEGDATWVHRFYDTETWSAPGGDFVPGARATILVGGDGVYTWGSNAEMVGDVQTWLESPATNFGWMVIGSESIARTAKRYNSREHPEAGTRPQLVVEFSVSAANQIVWPEGTQTFEEMAEGQGAGTIEEWSSDAGTSFSVVVELGTRPDSDSTRHLLVSDEDGASSVTGNRMETAFVRPGSPPDYYSWSLWVNVEDAVSSGGAVAIEHERAADGVAAAWGVRLGGGGAELFTAAFGGGEASAALFDYAGEMALGEWVLVQLSVDFVENKVFAGVNGEPYVELPIALDGSALRNAFRLAYDGGGAGNTATVRLDDIRVTTGKLVPVTLGGFAVE